MMLSLAERILFLLLVLASLGLSYFTFRQMFRIIGRGVDQLDLKGLPGKLATAARYLFTQDGLYRFRPLASFFHYLVAWAFIFYMLVNLIDVVEGYIEGFRFLAGTGLDGPYRLVADLLTTGALVGVLYLMFRRYVLKSKQLQISDQALVHPKARKGIARDSIIVGAFIFLHLGFRFLGQSFLVALEGGDAWQPVASTVAGLWSAMSHSSLEIGWHVSFWLALGLILLFLPYFPYTKHAHLFMGPVNFATRPKRRALGALNPLDFEDESLEQFGAATLTDLPQTHILDAFACIMCSRCQDVCPAYITGKELSPSAIEINKRYLIKENMKGLAAGEEIDTPLLGSVISESALWACTTCGACIEACPVGNEPMFDIMHMRRNQVLMESAFPSELKSAFNGMERLANPWGMTDDRMAWTVDLAFDVPTVEQNPDFDVLYWVGCAGAFDPASQEIARATVTVLKAANVNFAVLGDAETCTGDSARRAGQEYLYNEMALGNIETLNSIGAPDKTIVTGCPHCMHTIGSEYPALGGNYTVMHHSQFISDLIGQGLLTLQNGALETMTFHDPCYLGRHAGEYRAPRETLTRAGSVLLEMDRTRSNSLCCGAGGAQMWKEEEEGASSVSLTRFNEAASTGAKVVATACPFCAQMMNDANNDEGGRLKIKDVAQVVAESL